LLKTFEFVKQYTNIYQQPNANIAFTGGEPTVNPRFWDLVDYIKQNSNYTLGLTTNGTYAEKHTDTIIKNFVAATISWHAEIDKKLRDRAITNAIALQKLGFDVRVNVMMHTDLWNQSLQAYGQLVSVGVKTNPVIIGDGVFGDTDWFTDIAGTPRRTSHPYTLEQQAWYFKIKGLDADTIDKIKSGNTLPRSCCGNRDLMGKCNGCWTDIDAVNTNFKGWYCSVNKYFMHIEQHTGNVYHHQTCQATFNGRGPIGNLSNIDDIINYANKNKNKVIICPNQRCGCGMCAPKAKLFNEYQQFVD
jgi:MoaA/NifB/PqqE/SkfB family radical SAM enzyme